MKIDAMPFRGEPLVSDAAASRPISISAKYSAGPNRKANSTSRGLKSIIRMMPTHTPRNEANIAMKIAGPPLPCCASG